MLMLYYVNVHGVGVGCKGTRFNAGLLPLTFCNSSYTTYRVVGNASAQNMNMKNTNFAALFLVRAKLKKIEPTRRSACFKNKKSTQETANTAD